MLAALPKFLCRDGAGCPYAASGGCSHCHDLRANLWKLAIQGYGNEPARRAYLEYIHQQVTERRHFYPDIAHNSALLADNVEKTEFPVTYGEDWLSAGVPTAKRPKLA